MTSEPDRTRGFRPRNPFHLNGKAVYERPGSGEVVLFVHGTLDRARSFNRLARRLGDHSLVAYDRRGYQGSRDLGAADGIQPHIDDLLEILDDYSPEEPAIAVGHSFGGVVVLAAALQVPERFSHVVLFEPPMPWLFDVKHPHRGIPLDLDGPKEAEQFFRRMASDSAWERMSPDEQADRQADGDALISDLTIVRMQTPFSLDELLGLKVPLTMGIGSETEIPVHSLTAALLSQQMPAINIVTIDGAGHGAHLSHPGGLANMILEIPSARRSNHADPG